MLAPVVIPWPYLRWNMEHGAPFGAPLGDLGPQVRFVSPMVAERLRGPFQYQANNASRAFEYPWAFFNGNVRPGLDVLEIGGGVSGFQFALSRSGCRVTNVDPGMDLEVVSWQVDERTIRRLNKMYGTDVVLKNTDMEHADLPDSAFDVVFSISVLEHLGEDVMCSTVREAYRVLRPGGVLVLTIDLFLDVHPFSDVRQNQYGSNVNVRKAIEAAPFAVEIGTPSQLHGFPEFDRTRIQARLSEFLIGSYPTLTQCVVLRKP